MEAAESSVQARRPGAGRSGGEVKRYADFSHDRGASSVRDTGTASSTVPSSREQDEVRAVREALGRGMGFSEAVKEQLRMRSSGQKREPSEGEVRDLMEKLNTAEEKEQEALKAFARPLIQDGHDLRGVERRCSKEGFYQGAEGQLRKNIMIAVRDLTDASLNAFADPRLKVISGLKLRAVAEQCVRRDLTLDDTETVMKELNQRFNGYIAERIRRHAAPFLTDAAPGQRKTLAEAARRCIDDGVTVLTQN